MFQKDAKLLHAIGKKVVNWHGVVPIFMFIDEDMSKAEIS